MVKIGKEAEGRGSAEVEPGALPAVVHRVST